MTHQPLTTNHQPIPRRLQRIGHQHRDGQRADAAGHGRQRAGDFRDLGMHVADEDRALRLKQRQARDAPPETGVTRPPRRSRG